jgi:hypothetical protein
LEYNEGEWKIHYFDQQEYKKHLMTAATDEDELNNNQLFDNLVQEFNMMKSEEESEK